MASLRAAAALPRLTASTALSRTLPATALLSNPRVPSQKIDADGTPDDRHRQQQIRHRHSSRQVKRLFKNHPARRRVAHRMGHVPPPPPTSERKFPAVFEPDVILSNGWSKPPSEGDGFVMPDYPFRVERTKGKPNGAPGFLPVYSDCRVAGTKHLTVVRKVSGNQKVFINELRAVLGLPGEGGGDDPINVTTGGTIEIKGQWNRQVKSWLAGLGF